MASQEPAQRESFIVRVRWQPGQAVHEVWIQHVRSGETAVVHGLDQVVVFMERWAPLPAEKDRHGLR